MAQLKVSLTQQELDALNNSVVENEVDNYIKKVVIKFISPTSNENLTIGRWSINENNLVINIKVK